jgi:drug/metabolite transporter (DMT)-like permease
VNSEGQPPQRAAPGLMGVTASPYLMLVLAAVFFSSNIVIGRAVHADVPPVALSFFRWITASLIFLPFSIGPLRRQWRLVLSRWKPFLGLAVCGMLFGNTVMYMGLHYTTALNAGIVVLSRPLLIVMLSWIFLHTPATRRQMAGMAVAMAGVFAIVVRGDVTLITTLQFNKGDLLMLFASVGVAAYSVILPAAAKDLHPSIAVQVPMTLGILVLIPAYGFEAAYMETIRFDTVTVSAILAIAIFPSILAIWFINRGIMAIGPSRAGVFNYLTPVCIAILAISFLGEILEVYHAIGFVSVVAGIVIATRRRKRDPT